MLHKIIKQLTDFHHSVMVCLDGCQTDGQTEILSTVGTQTYPALMANLVEVVGNLYNYLLKTKGQTPYLVGVGHEFFAMEQKTRDAGIMILFHHIPRLFHKATGRDTAFLSQKDAEERKQSQCDILNYLKSIDAYTRIDELDEHVTHEIDKEFRGWINKLYSILCYLHCKLEDATDCEMLAAYKERSDYLIENDKPRIDHELKLMTNRTGKFLIAKINESIEMLFADTDPLWQKIVKGAFDKEKHRFSEPNVVRIFFEDYEVIMNDETYDHVAIRNLYFYDWLQNRLQKQEKNPEPECPIVPAAAPVDLSLFPMMSYCLSVGIKRDSQKFDLFLDGMKNVYKVIKPGAIYRSSWSHLFRFLANWGIVDSSIINQNCLLFAQFVYEVLSSALGKENVRISIEAIRRNMGKNMGIIVNDNLAQSPTHRKYLQEIEACFDPRLMNR